VPRISAIPIDVMKGYGTAQAAKMVGVSKRTLLEWIYRGELGEPKQVRVMGVLWRIWNASDIARALRVKARMRPGPRPKKSKRDGPARSTPRRP